MSISAEEKVCYLREAAIVLAKEGFQLDEVHTDRLCILLDGSPLCEVTESGGVAYRNEDIDEPERIAAKDKVYEIVRTTAEYMRQMEMAPFLKADGLEDGYKVLADFNGTVLAGTPSKHGVHFVTWDWAYGHTGVCHGHYFMDKKRLVDGTTALAEKRPRVIKIEPAERPQNVRLRVAAYTRVSSDSEDQLNIRLDSIRDSNRLYQQIDQGAVFSATYDAKYELPGVLLWELRDANTQYVTAEDVHKVLLFEQKDVFIVCTGLVFFAWGGFAGLYYVVSNAERFPKLAKLMIRKEFRRF